MRLGKFRKLTKDLPDSAIISYHGYYRGCCWSPYTDVRLEKRGRERFVIMNPNEDYDDRAVPKDRKQVDVLARPLEYAGTRKVREHMGLDD